MKLKLFCLAILGGIVSIPAFAQTYQAKNLDYYLTHAPFKMPAIATPVFKNAIYNIKDYGAVGDGQTLNTLAFEKAITACSSAGGGMVLIPAGLWLTGPIELKSNINLHAEQGALIIFSTDHTLYPILIPEGKVKSPIYGNKLENIAITGPGIYDGGGDSWRPLKKSKAAPSQWNDLVKSGGALSDGGNMYWPTKEAMDGEAYLKKLKGKKGLTAADYLPARDFMRPILVSIANSKTVLIDGPTFKNSPMFALNPRNCVNLTIQNVQINNEYAAQNGDGIDLSACKNAAVYHCTVNAGDDGICMKSSVSGGQGTNEAALQNIVIADCVVYHAHGGFVIGSNTDGGMRNVYVTNCNFINTDIGIRVKSSRGRGGLVHDIYIDNIFMRDILNEAILFNTYYEDNLKLKAAEVNKLTPQFKDFYVSNIYCNNAKTALSITGLPEMPINHINFSNMVISAEQPAIINEAADISLKNVKILSPQPVLFTLNNSTNFILDHIGFSNKTSTFVAINDANTSGIKVSNTNLKEMSNRVIMNKDANKKAVSIE